MEGHTRRGAWPWKALGVPTSVTAAVVSHDGSVTSRAAIVRRDIRLMGSLSWSLVHASSLSWGPASLYPCRGLIVFFCFQAVRV